MPKKLPLLPISLLGIFLLLSPAEVKCEVAGDRVVEEIKATLAQYVEAFNNANAEALAQFWVEGATYTDSNGDLFVGRDEILESFRNIFRENPGIKMELAGTRIEPASPGWAKESGRNILTYADGSLMDASYTAILTNSGNRWLIHEVVDQGPAEPLPHSENLKVLEWLIGEWKDEGDGMVVETTYEWSRKQNSIQGEFSITTDGSLEKDGIAIIGWDPVEQTIRSWLFDSDGGTAEAVWYERDHRWFSKGLHVLPDGRTGSSTKVLERVDNNSIRLRVINREVDGEMLPNLGPVTLNRVEGGIDPE